VPDYRDGQAPFGIWTVRRMLAAPQWDKSADPDLDVGFVVLAPRDGQNIQDILGANRLGDHNPGSLLRETQGTSDPRKRRSGSRRQGEERERRPITPEA